MRIGLLADAGYYGVGCWCPTNNKIPWSERWLHLDDFDEILWDDTSCALSFQWVLWALCVMIALCQPRRLGCRLTDTCNHFLWNIKWWRGGWKYTFVRLVGLDDHRLWIVGRWKEIMLSFPLPNFLARTCDSSFSFLRLLSFLLFTLGFSLLWVDLYHILTSNSCKCVVFLSRC